MFGQQVAAVHLRDPHVLTCGIHTSPAGSTCPHLRDPHFSPAGSTLFTCGIHILHLRDRHARPAGSTCSPCGIHRSHLRDPHPAPAGSTCSPCGIHTFHLRDPHRQQLAVGIQLAVLTCGIHISPAGSTPRRCSPAGSTSCGPQVVMHSKLLWSTTCGHDSKLNSIAVR